MRNAYGNGFYRYINDRLVLLTYTKPVVMSTLINDTELKIQLKDSVATKLYNDTKYKTIYDTISGPIALVIERGHYYFADSNFHAIKSRTKAYSRHRQLFLGSHYSYKRNMLIRYNNE